MEDYVMTIDTIKYYKDKACKMIGNRCDKCEAGGEYRGNPICQFDTVIRFIEYANKYKFNRKTILNGGLNGD